MASVLDDLSANVRRDHPGLLEEPPILLTLASFLETINASLPLIDYINRSSDQTEITIEYVNIFRQFTLFAASSLLDPEYAIALDTLDIPPRNVHVTSQLSRPQRFFSDARNFATRELQKWLQDGWSLHEGKYFVRRGQQVKEVIIDSTCMSMDLVKNAFVQTVEVLFGTMESLSTFSTT